MLHSFMMELDDGVVAVVAHAAVGSSGSYLQVEFQSAATGVGSLCYLRQCRYHPSIRLSSCTIHISDSSLYLDPPQVVQRHQSSHNLKVTLSDATAFFALESQRL